MTVFEPAVYDDCDLLFMMTVCNNLSVCPGTSQGPAPRNAEYYPAGVSGSSTPAPYTFTRVSHPLNHNAFLVYYLCNSVCYRYMLQIYPSGGGQIEGVCKVAIC